MPQVGHRSPHRREHFLNTHKGVLDGWIRFPVENVGNMRFIDFRIWSSLIFKYDLHWFSKWCSLIFHQEFQDLHCEPKDQIPQDSPALTSSASSFAQLSPWGWASWIDMGLSWDYHQVMGNPTFRWVDFWGLYGVSKGFLCDCYGFRMGKPTNIEDSMDWLCWGDLTQKPWFYTQNSWVFLQMFPSTSLDGPYGIGLASSLWFLMCFTMFFTYPSTLISSREHKCGWGAETCPASDLTDQTSACWSISICRATLWSLSTWCAGWLPNVWIVGIKITSTPQNGIISGSNSTESSWMWRLTNDVSQNMTDLSSPCVFQ